MLKAILWIITVFGLLPVTLLGLGHIISLVSIARLPKEPSEPGTVSFIGDVSIQVGSSSKLHFATGIWPAVVVVFGSVAVVVGLFFLLPRQPDRVRREGFSRVESYIDRLLHSRKQLSSLIVATPDGQHALLVMRQAGQTLLSVSVDRTKGDGQELELKRFFARLGMTPVRDYLSANGGVADATRSFEFHLVGDARVIARLCVSIFTDLFRVTDQQGLEFTGNGL